MRHHRHARRFSAVAFMLAAACLVSAGALAASRPPETVSPSVSARDLEGRAATPARLPSRIAPPAARPTAGEVTRDGRIVVPAGAPAAVQAVGAAGNRIAAAPYVYGGGHSLDFSGPGYDCSGSISFALHGAGLLSVPLDSGGLASWGAPGPGRWITIYARGDHAFMVVAGVRFDTSGRAARGTRWSPSMATTAGYAVRHPAGL